MNDWKVGMKKGSKQAKKDGWRKKVSMNSQKPQRMK